MRRQYKIIKIAYRFISLMLIILTCLSLSVFSVYADTEVSSGKIGKINWSFSGGTLEITGRGEMSDFTEQSMAPWNKYNKEIRYINIDDRITYIGELAFYDCSAIISIELSKNVKEIGAMAFAGCSSLESISMPKIEKLGEYAFSRCFKLDGVILPETLKEIGAYAFYRCESLTSIRVPNSVEKIGGSVFAYCSSLMVAIIEAPIEEIPEWTFYGCTQLTAVTLPKETVSVGKNAFAQCIELTDIYHNGSESEKENLSNDIIKEWESFEPDVIKPIPETSTPATSIEYKKEDNTGYKTKTEVVSVNGTDITVKTVSTHKVLGKNKYDEQPLSANISISATIDKKEAWDSLLLEIERQLLEQGAFEMQMSNSSKVIMVVNIKLLYNSSIYKDFLDALAGKDVILKITTPKGSRWSIDCSLLKGCSFKNSYDLEYELMLNEKVSKAYKKVVGDADCYWVKFEDKIDFLSTIELYIGKSLSRQTATLYEKSSVNNLQLIQSVLVGEDGITSYKMGNINRGKRYIVAINVKGVDTEDVIMPENSLNEGDWLENYVPVTEQYKITEVRGFMGLTMKQFTNILVLGFVGIALVVFVVILILTFNAKKKALEQTNKK